MPNFKIFFLSNNSQHLYKTRSPLLWQSINQSIKHCLTLGSLIQMSASENLLSWIKYFMVFPSTSMQILVLYSSTYGDITPYSSTKVNHISEEHVASISSVGEQDNQEASMEQAVANRA
jgi:hypothetical protein